MRADFVPDWLIWVLMWTLAAEMVTKVAVFVFEAVKKRRQK